MSSKSAVQMYTLRDHTTTAKDFAASLKKVSDIGYTAVQFSAIGCMNGESPEVDAAVARRTLDDNGLKCIATHRSLDSLMNKTSFEIDFHHALGCTYAAVGGFEGEQSIAGYRQFIQDTKPMIARLKEAGIQFGHHNHSKEFYKEEPHGMTLEDVLIDEGGPDLMLELDLYWIEHAGVNCVSVLNRSHGRVPVIHIKDGEVIAGSNDTRMAPVGEGLLDWDYIIPVCEAAGVEWYAVEQDVCYRDHFDCLKSSFEFLTSKGI